MERLEKMSEAIKQNRYGSGSIFAEYGVLSALFEMHPYSNVGLVAPNAQTAFDEAKKFVDSMVSNQCHLAGCYSDGAETKHTELCVIGRIQKENAERAKSFDRFRHE
jgi:hypothetical protein